MSPDERAQLGAELARETEWLSGVLEHGGMSEQGPLAGLELEAWLIDANGRPVPCNDVFLARVGDEAVGAGALRASIAIQVEGRKVAGDGLVQLERELGAIWSRCTHAAREMALRIVAVGILPSLREEDLRRPMLSDPARRRARQPLFPAARRHAIQLDIEGEEGRRLRGEYAGALLPEAAAGSLLLQLRLPASCMRRIYNASIVAAAPLVAMAGNSPLLCGQALCQETRIPLLEQAHAATARRARDGATPAHAGLGDGWARDSPLECFRDGRPNMKHWLLDAQPPERLVQLRARGDASWRWSQPGIGFDAEGRPQFRLDHGTLAAGPGIGDMLAQLAVAIGVFAQWASEGTPPESRISFADASANLQAAARSGLAARLRWFDGRDASASDAALDVLRDARAGLAALGVDAAVAAAWLDRMGRRIATHRTAARWQLARLQLRGGDLAAVTRDYAERAASNEPVHGWS